MARSGILVALLVGLYSFFLTSQVRASEIFNPWQSGSSLNDSYVNNHSVVFNDKLYLIGGTANVGPTRASILSNNINTNGSIGTWISQPSMPRELIWHSVILINNRIYVIGGVTEFPSNSTTAISYADIDESGNLSSWSDVASGNFLPESLGLGSIVRTGNYIYFMGGGTWNNGSISMSNDIYIAAVNGDGTIGTWADSNINLPTALATQGTVVDGNKIYVIGGTTNSSFSPTNKIYVFESNAVNGNLAQLADEDNLPFNSRSAMITRVGNYIIHAGGVGVDASPASDKVYFAPIDGSGIGPWELSTHTLPQNNCCTAITSWNNYVYIIGGHTNTGGPNNYYNSVWFARTTDLTAGPFELPIKYDGRLTNNSAVFRTIFWDKLTAAFDHVFKGGTFRPFTGNTYTPAACPAGVIGISCYDSHNGTDFSRTGGTEVYSVANGKVIFTSDHTATSCIANKGGFGCVAVVQYANDTYGLYAHLSQIMVDTNAEVQSTTQLGVMGNTGCPSCGVHLHFGVLKPQGISAETVNAKMKKKDWEDLLFTVKPSSTPTFSPFCTYKAPNGTSLAFVDPSSWKGDDTDPWSLAKKQGGCGITSDYLWKFDVGENP